MYTKLCQIQFNESKFGTLSSKYKYICEEIEVWLTENKKKKMKWISDKHLIVANEGRGRYVLTWLLTAFSKCPIHEHTKLKL